MDSNPATWGEGGIVPGGKRILVLTEALAEAGIAYDDIGLYETWTDLRRQEELNRAIQEVDYVTVASSSAAQALAAMLEPEQREHLTAKLISIGPSTTKTMEKLDFLYTRTQWSTRRKESRR